MSSVTKQAQHSSEPTAKKKFGKNLNKLTKPPAPPVASNTKSSASSRNGLLLLSTKRPSGNNPASSSSGAVGGILSNKPQAAAKPLPSLGLQYEPNTSTHDALLGAVVGASRCESQQQPDAWGVAEKNQKGGNDDLRQSQMQVESFPEPTVPEKNSMPPAANTYAEDGHHYRDTEFAQDRYDRYGNDNPSYGVQNGLLEDLGSRQHPGDNNDFNYGRHGEFRQGDGLVEDVQGLYMSRAAQERAEKHRLEEEARIINQKERSAQKLRELEERMATAGHDDDATPGETKPGRGQKPQVLLEKLDRANSSKDKGSPVPAPTIGGDRSSGRTLFDPNRTYSSLVGGSTPSEKTLEARSGDTDGVEQQREGRIAGEKPDQSPESSGPAYADANQYSRQVIHLSSYEDRDRGERGGNAGPRMLYDPKSGSMVAVPNREDSGPGGRRKERGKKGRTVREKDSKVDANAITDGPKLGRKGKGRKDENGVNTRGKPGTDSSSPSKADVKKTRATNSKRRLPRTCGVLYAKDEKGNFFCADGCDGDLGYGAHSVPGGRNKNPEAYAKIMEGQRGDASLQEDRQSDKGFINDLHGHEMSSGLMLQTGFNLVEPKETRMDWVKPNEKIVLVTGVDDSPTLQATAKAWAPSQATLAAIVQEKPGPAVSVGSIDDDDTDDDAPVSLKM